MKIENGANYELPTPIKVGYEFGGWYDKYEEKGNDVTKFKFNKKVESTGVWATDYDVDLYAKWTAKSYTVTLNLDGGSGDASATVKYDAKFTKSATKTGYTFNGWKYNGTNKGKTFTWDIDADATLTADWLANDQTVTLNLNGGTGITDLSVNTKYDATFDLPETNPTKVGYTFLGWFDGENNAVNASFTVKGDCTLTATWTAKTYTVTLNAGDNGTVTESTVSVTYDAIPTVNPIATPNNSDKDVFDGWFYMDGESKVEIDFTATWEIDNDSLTLTADWVGVPTTLTYLNEEDGTIKTVNTGVRKQLNLLTADEEASIQKEGYDITWQVVGGTDVYEAGELFTVSAPNMSLKLIYVAKKYTLTVISLGKGAKNGETDFVNGRCEIEVTFNATCDFSNVKVGTIDEMKFDKFVVVVDGEVTETEFDMTKIEKWTTASDVTIVAVFSDGKGQYGPLV